MLHFPKAKVTKPYISGSSFLYYYIQPCFPLFCLNFKAKAVTICVAYHYFPFFSLQVYEDEPVLQAFKLMRQKGVGGLPVVASGGRKAIGNISIRDIQFLLLAPEIYKEFRFVSIFWHFP